MKTANHFSTEFRKKYSLNDLLSFLDQLKKLKILLLGEIIIDEYVYCTAIGKSSKEPTLVVKGLRSEKFAGGVLAVANHISRFVKEVGLISYVGEKNPNIGFVKNSLESNVKPYFFEKQDSPTIVKRRYIEDYFFQKMFEIYTINDRNLSEKEDKLFCSLLKKQMQRHDAIVTIDFGHGLMTKASKEALVNSPKFLALCVQANAGNLGYHTISAYDRADFVSVAENELRLEMRDRHEDLQKLLKLAVKNNNFETLAVTRGSKGSMCLSKQGEYVEVPAMANKVVDRVGAGDAFFSIASLLASQGAPIDVTCFLGSLVATQAVATVGHRSSTDINILYNQIEEFYQRS